MAPLIPLTLAIGTWEAPVEAVADTGFEGGLVIPAWLRHEILADPDDGPVRLADAGVKLAPHWPGEIKLGNQVFRVEVVGLGKQFLLGREVLDQVHICFAFGNRWLIRFRDGEELVGEYSETDE